jgi:integrase
MAVKKLTAGFVREARAEPGKERTVYWDAALPSFGLMVTAAGHRSWVLQYRSGRVSRRLTINGVLGLEPARREARAILGQIARGADPVAERRKGKDSDKGTLRAVCEHYLAREGGKLRSAPRRKADLERLIYPALGNQQVEDIKRSDINNLLDNIEDRNGAVMADQARRLLARVFNWHAARSDEFRSPMVRGMTRAMDRQRDRTLTDGELCAIWKAAEAMTPPWSQYLRFLLLTATRRNEAARMAWSELSCDGLWIIPAARYKTKTEVTLPLSRAAKAVLAEIPHIEGCPFVFTTSGNGPITAFGTLKLWLDVACPSVKDWRIHDLRRTSRSLMSRAGVNPDTAERCLGHKIGGIRGVYDRHKYIAEMRTAFETLAAQIAAIVGPQRKPVVP